MKRLRFSRILKYATGTLSVAVLLIAVTNFPYDVGRPLSEQELAKSRAYYAEAYRSSAPVEAPPSDYDTKYLEIAAEAAKTERILERVSKFASTYGLKNGAVLELGSGRGYLQDVVANYTGLDLSPNVRRFYHKRFVLGSATAMPFPDNSFDGGWSIWVLEHIPNPEQALMELRRVMKHDAAVYLLPAYNCDPWAAEGYAQRPYSDFDWRGKFIKASIPVRDSWLFRRTAVWPARAVRRVASWFGPTRFHHRILEPNYKEYWQPDGDAVNGIDRHELMLWFTSRGDECLNCLGPVGTLLGQHHDPVIIRIHKHR